MKLDLRRIQLMNEALNGAPMHLIKLKKKKVKAALEQKRRLLRKSKKRDASF